MPVPRLVQLTEGPARLVIARHAESVGNVADAEARRSGANRLDLDGRDADVELSERGRRQAEALRSWIADAPDDLRPSLAVSSPYQRALETARIATSGLGFELVVDERLRERDLGVLDGLTSQGIKAEYGEEASRRAKLGKFYYQPPSGESWADVVLRVRTLLADLRHGFQGECVWLFTHQAVIMSLRYVLDGLDEAQILQVEKEESLANVSLTTYRLTKDGMVLETFGDTSPIATYGADLTHEESKAEAPRG
jgi:broad specificity phosphatase PhoE